MINEIDKLLAKDSKLSDKFWKEYSKEDDEVFIVDLFDDAISAIQRKDNILKHLVPFALKKGIELKNIDLTGISLVEEMNKADEERKEFEESILLYMTVNTLSKNINEIKDAREHVIEEFWDTVQANLGILDKLGINAQEVMSGYKKHLEKIKDRPRKRILEGKNE